MKVYLYNGNWTRELVRANPDKLFLFGDNEADAKSGYVPSSTQAVIRGLPNALGIPTKHNRGWASTSFFSDDEHSRFSELLSDVLREINRRQMDVVIPSSGIGTGKAMLPTKAPKCYQLLRRTLNALIQVCNN